MHLQPIVTKCYRHTVTLSGRPDVKESRTCICTHAACSCASLCLCLCGAEDSCMHMYHHLPIAHIAVLVSCLWRCRCQERLLTQVTEHKLCADTSECTATSNRTGTYHRGTQAQALTGEEGQQTGVRGNTHTYSQLSQWAILGLASCSKRCSPAARCLPADWLRPLPPLVLGLKLKSSSCCCCCCCRLSKAACLDILGWAPLRLNSLKQQKKIV